MHQALQALYRSPSWHQESVVTNQVAPGKPEKLESLARLNRLVSQKYTSRPLLGDDTASPVRVPLGIAEIDTCLNPEGARGIIANALHEVRVESCLDAASGAGFSLCLGLIMARKIAAAKQASGKNQSLEAPEVPPVFWICDAFTRSEYAGFYGPGLSAFGLAPENLIRIFPRTAREAVWAAGEIAAARNAASLCLMEIHGNPAEMDLTTSRRLMLRARASCTPVIILRHNGKAQASAAITRWHVSPAVSRHEQYISFRSLLGPPSFSVRLEKCRGGKISRDDPWKMEWNADDQCLVLLNPENATGRDTNRPFPDPAYAHSAIGSISSTASRHGDGPALSCDPFSPSADRQDRKAALR
jgi:hypothetical protein